ncbi:hypothetical protein MMC09_004215 [Bachmanniomyces sp. S44760]|nr:hypothetical protein [Bachmanniomyces sp. S44760]
MATVQQDGGRDTTEAGSRTSSVPLLGEGFSEANLPTSIPTGDNDGNSTQDSESDPKSEKRRFWGLLKKKEDEKLKKKAVDSKVTSGPSAPVLPEMQSMSPIQASSITSPPRVASYPPAAPSSPGRSMQSPSPRLHSPASSQIFERNVQEDGLAASTSPAIPSHITTENHIPPVLDASSVAITDDHLNPDNVEIVMHSAHQPAAMTVTGSGGSEAAGTVWEDDLNAHVDKDDAASNYGALDSNDVRRLSFISFADVVHAEHADSRDGAHLSGVPSNLPSLASGNRSPSPIRSPVSHQNVTSSPPMSGSPSFRGLETSPNRGGIGPGSPRFGHSPPTGGELTIETMRQALRKTGSGDLSGARSAPMSAVGDNEGAIEHPFK